jgi:hypothetical protein
VGVDNCNNVAVDSPTFLSSRYGQFPLLTNPPTPGCAPTTGACGCWCTNGTSRCDIGQACFTCVALCSGVFVSVRPPAPIKGGEHACGYRRCTGKRLRSASHCLTLARPPPNISFIAPRHRHNAAGSFSQGCTIGCETCDGMSARNQVIARCLRPAVLRLSLAQRCCGHCCFPAASTSSASVLIR